MSDDDVTFDVTEIRVSAWNFEKSMSLVSEAMLRGHLFRKSFDPITDEVVYQIIDPDSMRVRQPNPLTP